MITVTNLATGEEKVYSDMHPENAVCVAHLQSHGDYNTWDYKAKCEAMRPKITRGKRTVAYGDWCAFTTDD